MNLKSSLDIKKIPSPTSNKRGGEADAKKQRRSNLELYRIICMMMIVAHHYVVNSGLCIDGGPMMSDLSFGKSLFLTLFGAWGKTGINCFMMITGYFMCTNKITFRKFFKLMGQIYLYRWLFFVVFLVAGYETTAPQRLIKLVMPFWNITDGFVPCFIAFWLTIPFWTILVQNMNQRQHQLLLLLLLGIYSVLGSIPTFELQFNYVTWFGIIFLIASYIRLYPYPLFECKKKWGWMFLVSLILAMLSIVLMNWFYGSKGISYSYYFVSDSNKFFALVVAVCSFMWFKNMNIKYSKVINSIGAATFGVFLIHANSEAMRTWLWKDFIDVVGHSVSLTIGELVLFSVASISSIFIVCYFIDQLRMATIEKIFLNWYDCKIATKVELLTNKIKQKQ